MKPTKWKFRGLGLLGLALLWTFAGCATVNKKFDKFVDNLPEKLTPWSKSSSPKPTYYYHKVRYPGETLSIISEWYTGHGKNWRALARANPKLEPNTIGIGTKIRIPKKLLLTRERMPKRFVESVAKRQELERALLARANAPPRAKPARPKPTCHIHEVRYPGETLSIIAKWYTGDVRNWRALTKVNPKLDPNHIIIGARIRIPRKLLNTQKPMPRDFIVLTRPQREPKTSPSTFSREATSEKIAEAGPPSLPPEAEAGELELFGPR